MTMEGKLNLIAEKAKQDKRLKFTSLIHHINEENLAQCYFLLKRDKASGIDGVTVGEYGQNLKENIRKLVESLKAKAYRPQPVRRVYIPKAGKPNEKRGLGIPTVEDKLVQMMVKKLLEAIYEQDFEDFSHGFRSNRSCHTAIKQLNQVVMSKPINVMVEVDIRKFFDTVEHYWLLRCLEERVADQNLLWLIRKFLKAGVMEQGEYQASDEGTPQGGVISPLLANIYLQYVLDIWFIRKIKPNAPGYMEMIRYCDDFVVCCESEQDAKEFLRSLEDRFKEFGLSLSPDKTKIIKFGKREWDRWKKGGSKPETFNFLGFTHYCATSRWGKFKMAHKTAKENLARKLKGTQAWIKEVSRKLPLDFWWPILKSKLRGHYNYYGVSGNYHCLKQFYQRVTGMAFKWLNRRSQRRSMTKERYQQHLKWYPLPQPRICYALYAPLPTR